MTDTDTPGGADWIELGTGLIVPASAAPQPRLTAVDLFCGCGGFSLGIINAGYHVLAGVDFDCTAAVTYMHNLGSYPIDIRFIEAEDEIRFDKYLQRAMRPRKGQTLVDHFPVAGSGWIANPCGEKPADYEGVGTFFLGDICKLAGADILDAIGLEVGELDLIVGSPPCQGFTSANSKAGPNDERNLLMFEYARLVVEMQPKSMALENVPAVAKMLMPNGLPLIDEFCRILERGDYAEYDALRQVLQDDPTRRLARRKRPAKATTEKQDAAQTDLFAAQGGTP